MNAKTDLDKVNGSHHSTNQHGMSETGQYMTELAFAL